jgi:pyrimidine operon attenuation protein/uracil phosphoribosyltransferase
MKGRRLILDQPQLQLTIQRLCYQLIENHDTFEESVILGLQPRGIYLADRVQQELSNILPEGNIKLGRLDTTFFRDDFRRRDNPLIPNKTNIDFIIEDKKVILIDDVLFTGRTIRAGLDAMLAYGRPSRVELMVLVDRRYSRHLPIEPKYTGLMIDSLERERVEVKWAAAGEKEEVILTDMGNG